MQSCVKANGLADALKATEPKIQELCEVSGVAGLSISVIHHGETIYQQNLGHRDVSNKELVTSDTIFHIASMTKGFTGACIHLLRSQGKLALDDPVAEYIPGLKRKHLDVFAKLTISDLLGHRTGLQKADSMWLGCQGELLFERDDTTKAFSQLRPSADLRSKFMYNNICYAVLGEIVAKVAGQPFHVYLKENILDPLHMTRTVVTKAGGLPDNSSLAYGTLDDGQPYSIVLPGSSADLAMGSAGGLLSTANDLGIYYKALLSSWQRQAQAQADGEDVGSTPPVLNDVNWLLAPLQIMEVPTFREKAYASGWARSQLPTTVGDIGVNPGLVEKMPTLAKGVDSQLALWHQGSLVGATSFVMLLPETESAVLVLTNTMALNDAADWIGQLLVETLLESPVRHDYVQLARESAVRALSKYAELSEKVEKGRQPEGVKRAIIEYAGTYVGFGGIFRIVVEAKKSRLYMLFQGRESQRYSLQHHHDDTFTWFMSWNEQVKRGRFIVFRPELYSIRFRSDESGTLVTLNWQFDGTVLEGEDFVKE